MIDVLDRHQMVCKPTKACPSVKEVKVAGHVVGHGQRRPMPGKLAPLTNWERPKIISDLRSSRDCAILIFGLRTNVCRALGTIAQDAAGWQEGKGNKK